MSNNNFSFGYIILSRSISKSSIWYKPPLYLKVFVYLLGKAQHKDFRGLKRGQLFINYNEIMSGTASYYGNRKETPTKDQIQNIMEWLRNPRGIASGGVAEAPMITTVKATHGTVVTICNYDTYQDPKSYESNSESISERPPKASRKQRQASDINKNDKHYNNEILIKEFEEFWLLYDKKEDKEDSKKLFLKTTEEERILIKAHLEKYIPYTSGDPQFRKSPKNYLKGKCWLNEVPVSKPQKTNQSFGGGAPIPSKEDFENIN